MALITITESYGGNGGEIARRVAQTLGWTLVDDQVLRGKIVAKGFPSEDVERLDEKAPGFFELFFRTRPHVFVKVLESAVYDAARGGEAVIVGHGSQVLLQDFDCAFHVRLLESESRRAAALAKRSGMDPEAARRLIRQGDRDRAGFLKFAYRIDGEDPNLYDLVIHLNKFDAKAAADLIIAAARAESLKECSLGALEAMEKLELEKRVRAELIERHIDPAHLLIEVPEKGRVRLAGVATNAEDRQRILDAVRAVPGVKEVSSQIEVVRGWD
ncbi:MAG: cytidylate kinase family protein [Desulfobacterales bacterium]